MKICSRCKKEKSFSEFGKQAKSKDGYQYHCRECKAELHQENHPRRMESIRASKSRRVQAGRDFVGGFLLENPCVDCGNEDIRVLEFDHIRGKKRLGVAVMVNQGYTLDTIKSEISKCEVRCRNCHTIKTYERLGGSWHENYTLVAP